MPDQPTLLSRMLAAGIAEDRARAYLAAGAVRLDGEVVTDPEREAPWETRWVVNPP